MSEELRPALSHKDSLLRINELIEERDYWKLRYEVARDVAIEEYQYSRICDKNPKKFMADARDYVNEEIERRVKGNK